MVRGKKGRKVANDRGVSYTQGAEKLVNLYVDWLVDSYRGCAWQLRGWQRADAGDFRT